MRSLAVSGTYSRVFAGRCALAAESVFAGCGAVSGKGRSDEIGLHLLHRLHRALVFGEQFLSAGSCSISTWPSPAASSRLAPAPVSGRWQPA